MVTSISDKQKIEILNLYNKGLNRLQIASKVGLSEWAVRKQLTGNTQSKSDRLKLINRLKCDKLSYHQNQLILGSLVGDASIMRHKKSYVFQVSHCLEQEHYLKHKANILNTNAHDYIKSDDSYSAGKVYYQLQYFNVRELELIYNICTNNGVKNINDKWINNLDSKAIAYWYMDDGTSTYINNGVMVRFSTLSFNEYEIDILRKRLYQFDIETTKQSHSDGKGLIIYIRQHCVNKFMNMIDPHIIECMRYKVKKKI